MTGRSASKNELAAEAWDYLFDFFVRTRWQRDEALERLGLTPNDARALNTLDVQEGKRMRALAEEWGTDASNVTWVIDRLERKGLAKRTPLASDRRVTLVLLTARGARARDELLDAFRAPPPELLTLSREELRTLGDLLRKVGASVAQNTAHRQHTDR